MFNIDAKINDKALSVLDSLVDLAFERELSHDDVKHLSKNEIAQLLSIFNNMNVE